MIDSAQLSSAAIAELRGASWGVEAEESFIRWLANEPPPSSPTQPARPQSLIEDATRYRPAVETIDDPRSFIEEAQILREGIETIDDASSFISDARSIRGRAAGLAEDAASIRTRGDAASEFGERGDDEEAIDSEGLMISLTSDFTGGPIPAALVDDARSFRSFRSDRSRPTSVRTSLRGSFRGPLRAAEPESPAQRSSTPSPEPTTFSSSFVRAIVKSFSPRRALARAGGFASVAAPASSAASVATPTSTGSPRKSSFAVFGNTIRSFVLGRKPKKDSDTASVSSAGKSTEPITGDRSDSDGGSQRTSRGGPRPPSSPQDILRSDRKKPLLGKHVPEAMSGKAALLISTGVRRSRSFERARPVEIKSRPDSAVMSGNLSRRSSPRLAMTPIRADTPSPPGSPSPSSPISALAQAPHPTTHYPFHRLLPNLERYSRFCTGAYGRHFMRIFGAGRVHSIVSSDPRHPADHYAFAFHTGVPLDCILLSSSNSQGSTPLFASPRMEPLAHFVVVDREARAVVLTLRGTLGLSDAMTDLAVEYEPFLHDGRTFRIHGGMMRAAKLLAKGSGAVMKAVAKALADNPGYGFVLVSFLIISSRFSKALFLR
ncbi:hypothetical protein BDK51DRAFT_49828 [Blyttiomyces helicus]|uniref:Uncharacterized protein n=1 Tax=Blyttiomyces helicus TaxID=388810 RepID=A0A4P9VVD8_9FUNG|nr:hypothetical protein BDK51DRAFT_49828 [Blyttiomyces helicus]|eukprot:RKO83604.1 hypothetical protein BDK51DRAFT_49828 [Blyttiomyces helicus]